MSYFEQYFNLSREKTLRSYSRPVDLSRFDSIGWMTAEEDPWAIPQHLCDIAHRRRLIARPARTGIRPRGRTSVRGGAGRAGGVKGGFRHRRPLYRGEPSPAVQATCPS